MKTEAPLWDLFAGPAAGVVTGLLSSLVLGAMLLPLAGHAQAMPGAGDVVRLGDMQRGGLLFKSDREGVYIAAPTLKTDVRMVITGMIARVRVAQHFHNPSPQWLEGVYVFPLPETAAVDHLRLYVGERVIEGRIKERHKARAAYEKARREGRRAALTEQERPNIFTNAVANIGPGRDVRVEIEYQQAVAYDQGVFRLRFPMVVAPRYIPGAAAVAGFAGTGWAVNTERVPDAARITPPVTAPATGPVNPVSLEADLEPGFPLAHLDSAYHKVNVSGQENGRYRVTLEPGAFADRDFELSWRPAAGRAPQAALFTEARGGAAYALLMVVPPVGAESEARRLPREVVFVIDTSGSMHGDSLTQARAALRLALERLTPQDRFNVIRFNSRTEMLFPAARPAHADAIVRARHFVDGLRADGGTEMAPALEAALGQGADTGILRQIIFLTDGSVGDEARLFAIINARLGDSRLFTVGIGSAPNGHFMREAARLGRGTFTYIGKVDEVRDKMARLFSKLESPVLTDIRVHWPDGAPVEAWPARVPDLYAGEPIVISARPARLAGDVVLSGTINGEAWRMTLPLAGGRSDSGIAVLWARRKIAALLDSLHGGAERERVRAVVTDVALRHHLVSKYTSLVAEELTPVRPAGAGQRRTAVPVNLPAGWSHEKVFGALPRTATSAPLNVMLGLLLFVSAALLYRVSGARR